MANYKINENLLQLVCISFYRFIFDKYNKKDKLKILSELYRITNYDIDYRTIEKCNIRLDYVSLQEELAIINEKSPKRKKHGVYYTPHDLVEFIVVNLIKAYYSRLTKENLSGLLLELDKPTCEDLCFNKSVFDPTCGTGEFLLEFLDVKCRVLERVFGKEYVSQNILRIISTIYGNDINSESIILTKIRILLYVLEHYGVSAIKGLVNYLDNNFTYFDYVSTINCIENKFDIILGNPPYVEDSKSFCKPVTKYGNIYANVIENSTYSLSDDGVIGFVIPLSYVATPRMNKIRTFLKESLSEQYLLSYSDRPDCLFASVHQKLNIIIAKKGGEKRYYTSNYKYWYKKERSTLFDNIQLNDSTDLVTDAFIPKIGNKLEQKIFKKVYSTKNSIYSRINDTGKPLYLNMRATFWLKAFLNEHKGSEYKVFNFTDDDYYFIMCLFNSSLFWWFWVCISDCWHITQKELKSIRIPTSFNRETAKLLAEELEKMLEETKLYVGTKQTDYEYKHKSCLTAIHRIDDYISASYGLNKREAEYIKMYNLKYRIGVEQL